LVIADVVVVRAEAQLGWEFLIAGVDPRDVAAVGREVSAFLGWEREKGDFINAVADACKEATDTFDEAVSPCGRIALGVVNGGDLVGDLGDAKSDVAESSPELAGGAVIRRGRRLDVGDNGGRERKNQEEGNGCGLH